jgi:hypothetical protein
VALGYASVSKMLSEMTAAELADWKAYFATKPFPIERIENSIALITTMYANSHRDSKKQREPFEVRMFMPDWRPKAERDAEEKRKFKQQIILEAKRKQIENAFKQKAAELEEQSSG